MSKQIFPRDDGTNWRLNNLERKVEIIFTALAGIVRKLEKISAKQTKQTNRK